MRKMMMRFLPFLMAAFMYACAPKGYTPYYATSGVNNVQNEYDQITLKRTACYGFCPVYEVTAYEQDILIFHGERFVAETGGSVSKRMPEGSFKKLMEIAKAHGFSDFDGRYPNQAGDNCGPVATDMPSVIIAVKTKRLAHEVNVYQGCRDFDGRARFEAMVAEMDAVFDVDDFVGPRENFSGGEQTGDEDSGSEE